MQEANERQIFKFIYFPKSVFAEIITATTTQIKPLMSGKPRKITDQKGEKNKIVQIKNQLNLLLFSKNSILIILLNKIIKGKKYTKQMASI